MKIIQTSLKAFLVVTLLSLSFTYSQTWSPLGNGTGWGNTVAVYNGELYAGGVYGIMKWNGVNWEYVGGNTTGEVKALVVYQNKLMVGGSFVDVGNLGTPYLASWDGNAWNDLGGTTNSLVQTLAVWNNKLIIGGYFTQCENLPANHIVQYDGNNFTTLGSGTGGSQGQVMAVTAYGNDLIAGGFFSTAGGISVNRIAKWDGSSWSTLGSGIGGIVYSLGVHNGNLIAGGLFSSAGGGSANGIASWNGSAWSALGSGCGGGFYPYVHAILSHNGYLYSGGYYTIAGGQTCNGIAKWDGNNWSPLGSGFWNSGANVFGAADLCVFNNELIATGMFTTAGGVGASNIAKWNGLLTGVSHNNGNVPDKFSLNQNYPNPFNPSTNISFSLPVSGFVKLSVYDNTGKEAVQIVNENLGAGNYNYTFNASGLSSGVYFYTIKTNEFADTKKMILIK